MADDNTIDGGPDDGPAMLIFPPGTVFFEPDDIHQVTIQFPDEDAAILFFEFCKDVVSVTSRRKG